MKKFPPENSYTREYLKYHTPNRIVPGTGIASFNVFENMHRNEIVASMVSGNARTKCLDLGCGRAPNTILLAEKGLDVTALDLDPKELEQARAWVKERGFRNAGVVRGDMNNLPFKNAEFDVVVCVEALEHTEDMAKSGRELVRVLKPGGYAIITLPNSSSIMWKLIHAFKKAKLYSCPRIEYGREFHTELPLREIYRLMGMIGLEVTEMRSINVIPIPMVYNFLPRFMQGLVLRFSYLFRGFDLRLGAKPFFREHGGSVIMKCMPKNSMPKNAEKKSGAKMPAVKK